MLYGRSAKIIRFSFSSQKTKGAQKLTFKNSAASLPHTRFAIHAKLKLQNYQGAYDPDRICTDDARFEQIKLKPSI